MYNIYHQNSSPQNAFLCNQNIVKKDDHYTTSLRLTVLVLFLCTVLKAISSGKIPEIHWIGHKILFFTSKLNFWDGPITLISRYDIFKILSPKNIYWILPPMNSGFVMGSNRFDFRVISHVKVVEFIATRKFWREIFPELLASTRIHIGI